MSYTNFPNGVSSMGVPLIGGGFPLMPGNVFFVNPTTGDDTNYDGKSADKPFATIATALAACTTNNDDVIVLSTYAQHTISAMLDVSINRVHFVGDVFGRKYGARARMVMGVTTATTDVFLMKNTGVGNTFTGIKFDSGNTLSEATGTVGEGGEYAVYRNCEFYNSAKLTSNTHAEMVLNGDSAQFYDCTFGSLATAVSGDKIRPAVLLTENGVATGKVSRDVLFDGCRFWKNAGGTTTAMVKGAATDIERVMEFHDCQFVANPLGSTPAVAIDVGNLTEGFILLTGDTAAAHCTKIGTATGIFSCLNTKVATATIAIQAT
jgi:hypothetical protein